MSSWGAGCNPSINPECCQQALKGHNLQAMGEAHRQRLDPENQALKGHYIIARVRSVA